MDQTNYTLSVLFIFLCMLIPCVNQAGAQIERFTPRQPVTTEIWRITDNPLVRHWANYHNTDAWSPDGRYICYESFAEKHEIHLYDLYKNRDIKVDEGTQPRWANNNNWLFYVRTSSQDDSSGKKYPEVVWFDVDTGKRTRIAGGVRNIGETDSEDRWLFGSRTSQRDLVRIPIYPDSRPEDISGGGARGSFMIPNPCHPVVMYRGDSRDSEGRELPFAATRFWSDLEGKNVAIGSPMVQRCHQAWSGDGSYFLHGNSQVRGRRWNEPFPSNMHYLASMKFCDICACGRSGRWIIGSANIGSLPVADLRSGDAWIYLWDALSLLHDSDRYSYSRGSGWHDNDAKGSPDGTKVVFISNYDLRNGPATEITEEIPDNSVDRIPVRSTEGFPETGRLSVLNEVIGYTRKTPTGFEGLTRGLFNTPTSTKSLREDLIPEQRHLYIERPFYHAKGTHVSLFDARLIPEEQRENMPLPPRFAKDNFPGNKNSPLIWQRQTDVFTAVIRLPDRPHLHVFDKEVELIPGENHRETYGYFIFKDGKKITGKPLRPGSYMTLSEAGTYTAVAVEWSGLESPQSLPLQIHSQMKLSIRQDKPADFSWIYDRWSVNGKEVTPENAKNSQEAIREIVHILDGVIHREWYSNGLISRRYDLNSEGKPIRRLFYRNGKLIRREFHNREDHHVSTEYFDSDGYITESIRNIVIDRKLEEYSHWWYEKGMPVKLVGSEGHNPTTGIPGIYVKDGDNWVKKE